METPPPEPMMRRNTRSALVEIPVRMGALSVTDNIRPSPNGHHSIIGLTNLNIETGLPAGYVSPAPSPDELVIQARGRRRLPVNWSPDEKASPSANDRTPVKGALKQPCSIVLRSTPRKRLLLNDMMDLSPSPEKKRNLSPAGKKAKLDRPMGPLQGPVDIALRALSNDQLIEVIQNIIIRHPDLEEEIKSSLPAPDLRPLLERLHDLKRNIFKSLPNSRLSSKTDSPAYARAATHVLAFKKCVVEQARCLASSCQWEAVVEYVLGAWGTVRSTPVWDNPPHNAPRRHTFKFLTAQLMSALKRGTWTQEQLGNIYSKIESFVQDSEDIKSCLKQLDSLRSTK